jgi:hypothetical protein
MKSEARQLQLLKNYFKNIYVHIITSEIDISFVLYIALYKKSLMHIHSYQKYNLTGLISSSFISVKNLHPNESTRFDRIIFSNEIKTILKTNCKLMKK